MKKLGKLGKLWGKVPVPRSLQLEVHILQIPVLDGLGFGNPSFSKAPWVILMSSWEPGRVVATCALKCFFLYLWSQKLSLPSYWPQPASRRADSTPRFNIYISKNIDSTGLLGSLDEFIHVGC